jgi:hypothetical protein
MKWVKRILIVLLLAFALFYLFAQPEAAAAAVRNIFGAVARAFNSLLVFFTSLAG